MILNIEGEAFEFEGKRYVIGTEIIGTDASDYNGLLGVITEIRDGADKETENETPDIYCTFEAPVLDCEIERIEKIFSELYDEPKTIDEIGLDEIIMAPDMILLLSEVGKKTYSDDAAIREFRDEYAFLSNFYNAEVSYKNFTFKNSEAAFQAMKNPSQAKRFTELDAKSAKKLGRSVQLRPDWETVKYDIMYEICNAKFSQNSELKEKLLSTGKTTLIEGNSWGDTEWGIFSGKGENKLGKILMCVREELR